MLDSGFILCGGVGAGKSMTALAYYYVKECNGKILMDGSLVEPRNHVSLYIITTARKRDTLEWEDECGRFGLSTNRENSACNIKVVVDSWNNLHKYENVEEKAFYIFDEQRVVGSGAWVKSFLKITRRNRWILLTATPGDSWMDYIPVFIANGFYKNRTDFLRLHAVYNRYSKYPKIDKFIDCGRLEMLRRRITIKMDYKTKAKPHKIILTAQYEPELYKQVSEDRWNPFDQVPIKDISEYCYVLRKVVNSDRSRLDLILSVMKDHPKLIIFYNFDYELEALRGLSRFIVISEWNGHKHEEIPKVDKWLYLVQYAAGAEGWNCIETNAVVFYSQNYSYKTMTQAAGRIDRVNTRFGDLYYYHIRSSSWIDIRIASALRAKRDFNVYDMESGISRQKHAVL